MFLRAGPCENKRAFFGEGTRTHLQTSHYESGYESRDQDQSREDFQGQCPTEEGKLVWVSLAGEGAASSLAQPAALRGAWGRSSPPTVLPLSPQRQPQEALSLESED